MLENLGGMALLSPWLRFVSQGLEIEQKAKVGQKKLALNKTNKSLSGVNIFTHLVR